LENVSSLPIDFLRLSFEDSTMGPAQEALSEGELSVFEGYETEYDLLHRRAFSWRNDKEITNIMLNQKVVLSVTCLGKVGWYAIDRLSLVDTDIIKIQYAWYHPHFVFSGESRTPEPGAHIRSILHAAIVISCDRDCLLYA